jgi:hypothetical protein
MASDDDFTVKVQRATAMVNSQNTVLKASGPDQTRTAICFRRIVVVALVSFRGFVAVRAVFLCLANSLSPLFSCCGPWLYPPHLWCPYDDSELCSGDGLSVKGDVKRTRSKHRVGTRVLAVRRHHSDEIVTQGSLNLLQPLSAYLGSVINYQLARRQFFVRSIIKFDNRFEFANCFDNHAFGTVTFLPLSSDAPQQRYRQELKSRRESSSARQASRKADCRCAIIDSCRL